MIIRRIVTGVDETGTSVVLSDGALAFTPRHPAQQVGVVWATDSVPADTAADIPPHEGARIPNGAAFRVVVYEPGCTGKFHATPTLDYGVVVSGSIFQLLDNGVEIELKTGDLLVQRATKHQWINRSAKPCTMAFVVIDALRG